MRASRAALWWTTGFASASRRSTADCRYGIGDRRVEIDEHADVGGHGLAKAGKGRLGKLGVEAKRRIVPLGGDRLAELDEQRVIAHRANARARGACRRGHGSDKNGRNSTPRAERRSRTVRAIATAPGPSPWTQIEWLSNLIGRRRGSASGRSRGSR